jgi:hypothetical protein
VGYVAHDAVLAVTAAYREGGLPDIEAFRQSIPERFRRLVIGPVQGVVNSDVMYVFLPDGSKEGWEDSAIGNELRERFRALFRQEYDDGSSHDDVVSVRFGADFRDKYPPLVTVEWPRTAVGYKAPNE